MFKSRKEAENSRKKVNSDKYLEAVLSISDIDCFLPNWAEKMINPGRIRDCEKGKWA